MGTRKKGVELIFNLQWRNKPDNGGDKSNVIGMYDTALTTTNFDMFKSYLLKNSGVAGNDLKVTYLTDNGQEWIIDSQQCFEIALNAFRLKARLGEVIFLKLDKSSNGKPTARKHSNDVETQSDVASMGNNMNEPPEWFVNYMKKFKREFVEEVTYKVSYNLAISRECNKEKENVASIPVVITTGRKLKPDISKRSRKHLVVGEAPIDKELFRTLKYDRKLENKLDKLDAKTKKIKEKKQALINKIESSNVPVAQTEGEEPKTSSILKKPAAVGEEKSKKVLTIGTEQTKKADTRPFLNATCHDSNTFERAMGGDLFLRRWFVRNSGQQTWSANTELRLTWGSSELVPSMKAVSVPPLVPGEATTVSICFQVPKKPGTYETYWNFYDGDIRFGSSLSCCVIVEEPLNAINPFESHQQAKKDAFPMYKLFNETNTENKPIEKKESNATAPKKVDNAFESKDVENCSPFPIPWSLEESVGTMEDAYRAQCGVRRAKILAESGPKRKPVKVLDIFSLSSDDECVPFLMRKNEREKTSEPYSKKERKRDVLENSSPLSDPYLNSGIEIEPLTLQISSPFTVSPINIGSADAYNDLVKFAQMSGSTNSKPNNPIHGNYSSSSRSTVAPHLPPVGESENKIQEHIQAMGVGAAGPTRGQDATTEIADVVMDLSKRVEHIKIAGPANGDSDSDWESMYSYERRVNQLCTDSGERRPSNKYGINEKDLIVDLSMNGKAPKVESDVKQEVKEEEQNANINNTEDNNNNNGSSDNNNSGESFCEVDSEASSVSSGYDVLQIPVCEEKEDGSGYVYITIDGNKLPVPRHILRADFLAHAEEAPAPLPTDDERSLEPQSVRKEEPVVEQAASCDKSEPERTDRKQESPKQGVIRVQPLTSLHLLQENFIPDNGTGRLFIFPQSHPGYEVVADGNLDMSANKKESSEVSQDYNWAKSPTQYSLSDNSQYLRNDPYGPLDHTDPFMNPTPEQNGFFVNMVPPSPCPYGTFYPAYPHDLSRPFPPCVCLNSPEYLPNHQQGAHTTKPNVKCEEAPSAPPEPPKPAENATAHGMPMMLPENLVTGAVNVASSAINTARSVINMISQPKKEPGRWVHGHWVTDDQNSCRAKNLLILAEMGFDNADLNATLLARYNDDLQKVIIELIDLTS